MTNIDYKLELLDNAKDSLIQAIECYQRADKEKRLYKFSILHTTHFAELFLKHYVSLESSLLIYRNPNKDITDSSRTISLEDAIKILKNLGANIPKELERNLTFIKKIRNQIEHHHCKYNSIETRLCIGQVIYHITEFNRLNKNIDLKEKIEPRILERIEALEKGFIKKLDQDRDIIARREKEHYKLAKAKKITNSQFNVLLCYACGNYTVIQNDKGDYECLFCENKPDYIYKCKNCNNLIRDPECNKNDQPYCDYCVYKLSQLKDE